MVKQMNIMFDVISDIKLEWMKVISVDTDKFGSWVSGNWLSVINVHGHIDSMMP